MEISHQGEGDHNAHADAGLLCILTGKPVFQNRIFQSFNLFSCQSQEKRC